MSKQITFSDKYNPLFDLLLSKELIGVGEYEGVYFKDLDKDTQEYYKELYNVDTVLISGGRDSGKTFGLGCFVGVSTSQFDHRVLYTRQTMTSTKNSISKALENRLEDMGIRSEYEYANFEYKYKKGKGLISITGQKTSSGTQTAKLKSLEDYSIFITDEGEELESVAEWKKIKRSMRAQDVQCLSIISFNPPVKSHWLYVEFYKNVPEGFNGIIDNVLYIHTTYLDNGEENMAAHNWKEYEQLRELYEIYMATPAVDRKELPKELQRKAKEYKNVVLGGFRDIAEGVIFNYDIGDFVYPEYGLVYGADQGYTHPSTVIAVNVDKDKRRMYLKEIYYETEKTTDYIVNKVKPIVGFDRIWADSAAALFIADLKKAGLNIKGAKKPKIWDSINAMLNYEIIIDKNSLNLQREFNEYRWNPNKPDEPIDDNNHGIDAVRYAFTMRVNQRIAQPL